MERMEYVESVGNNLKWGLIIPTFVIVLLK